MKVFVQVQRWGLLTATAGKHKPQCSPLEQSMSLKLKLLLHSSTLLPMVAELSEHIQSAIQPIHSTVQENIQTVLAGGLLRLRSPNFGAQQNCWGYQCTNFIEIHMSNYCTEITRVLLPASYELLLNNVTDASNWMCFCWCWEDVLLKATARMENQCSLIEYSVRLDFEAASTSTAVLLMQAVLMHYIWSTVQLILSTLKKQYSKSDRQRIHEARFNKLEEQMGTVLEGSITKDL